MANFVFRKTGGGSTVRGGDTFRGTPASGAQTVSPGLIDQTAVLFSPQVNQQIQIGLIDQTGILFSPKVNQSVSVGLIDQSGVLFAPKINLQVQIPLIDQSGVTFAPVITQPGPQTVTVTSIIDQSGVLFSPNINQQVRMGLIDQSGVLFSPTVNQKVSVGLINQTGILFNPQINLTVSLNLINQSGVVFNPTVTQASGAQTVNPGLIDQSGTVFTPTISGGAVTVRLFVQPPDIEAIAARRLRDAAISEVIGVYSSIPKRPSYPLITVKRTGGEPAVRQYLDAAIVQIEIWANSKSQGHDIAQAARIVLLGMEGQSITVPVPAFVSGVDDSQGLAWEPDQSTGRDRYLFAMRIYARGV